MSIIGLKHKTRSNLLLDNKCVPIICQMCVVRSKHTTEEEEFSTRNRLQHVLV